MTASRFETSDPSESAAACESPRSSHGSSGIVLDGLILSLAPGFSIHHLNHGALLFSESDQLLHQLNGSSAFLAAQIDRSATPAELAAELAENGIEPAIARQWVRSFLLKAVGFGALATDLPRTSPDSGIRQPVRLGGVDFELSFSDPTLFGELGAAYAHLESDEGTTAHHRFRIAEAEEFVLISHNDGPALVVERALAAIALKGEILEQVLDAPGHLAALHAACLVKDGNSLLLLGSPGAGKTTMALALLGEGFAYGSDDVTLLQPDGRVAGVALAPGVKENAWPVALFFDPGLLQTAVHIRPDGQAVRFASMSRDRVATPGRVTTIVRLQRTEDGGASLDPVPSGEVLAALLRESRSKDGCCSAATMHALTELVRGARCFDLRYGEARQAAPLLRQAAIDE